MTVLAVMAVSENTLPSFCWLYKYRTVLAVLAVSVVTATPLKLNPPFSVIL